MTVSGAQLRTCPDCHGACTLKPDNRVCTKCNRHGVVVVCAGCGDLVTKDEAKEEGEYCTGCRTVLDHPETLEKAS